ncbi:MAG: hypothetical protein KDC52_02370, partial [Ignavibacteriae bacterium]|nr:hypothetical protein [Ignavibacteriota bacterium]
CYFVLKQSNQNSRKNDAIFPHGLPTPAVFSGQRTFVTASNLSGILAGGDASDKEDSVSYFCV